MQQGTRDASWNFLNSKYLMNRKNIKMWKYVHKDFIFLDISIFQTQTLSALYNMRWDYLSTIVYG